jgi:hypothetical protein
MMHEILHQIIAQVDSLIFNPSSQGRGTAGSAVETDTVAVPVSADNPANTEEGIPLLPLPENSSTARADTKVAQWLAALSLTALAQWMVSLIMDSPCHPASQVSSLKHRTCIPPSPTSSRNILIGTRAAPVGLMWPTAVPVCRAQHIYARHHTTITSSAKTPSNTSTWVILAAQSSGTRPNFFACDGLGRQRIAM